MAAGEIDPSGCEFDVADCNMMVVLPKAPHAEWATLEIARDAPQQQEPPASGAGEATAATAADQAAEGAGHGPHVEKLLYELD